ncbi:UNVERIFIED_CONTAM: Nucleobase-ascorbate transporter 1, partial [Sesamum radiatum]
GKCGAPWTNSSWKPESCSDFRWLHDILSILGKFGAVFASIPFPIFAALYCVLFGLVGSVGLSFLQFTNMNSMRNLFITGLSLFLGISIPQFFDEYWVLPRRGLVHTNAGW